MPEAVLILGATSAIARHVAASFAARGRPVFLAGRNVAEVERLAADLRIRYGVEAAFGRFEAEDYEGHHEFLRGVVRRMGDLEGVVLAFGYLGEQEAAEKEMEETFRVIDRNFTGAVSILNQCAGFFETRRGGFVVAVSSVAGDVGRQSNYLYGAAKGGLNVYLQGLRARLYGAGVRVVTVKPGFVDTPMTYGRPKLFLVASPREVGERIARAAERGGDVVYVPWFWRFIMLALKLTPEAVRKRLKL
jgi:decaprenylphospho-beta-D-erythro-pentofuranosid-2-ulose 2-reductase